MNTTGFLAWWYRLTLPPNMPQDSPQQRQRIRYARLTSGFALLLGTLSFVAFPLSAINPPNPITPYIQAVPLLCIMLALLVGKLGRQYLSASLVVICSMISVVGSMVTNPLDPIFVPNFCILVIPVILAASLMPPIASLITGVVASGIVIAITVLHHHTAYYDSQMKLGFYSETVFVPIFTIVVVAIVSYVIMRSLIATIYRADQAEEILHLQEEVANFQLDQQSQQQAMRDAVMLIARIHARIANGDFSARVPLDELGQNSPLWPVAVPLNNLLNRVQQWKNDSEHKERLQYALAQLTQNLTNARRSFLPGALSPAANELEPLCIEINQLLQFLILHHNQTV